MSHRASFARFKSLDGATIYHLSLEVSPNFWGYAYAIQKADEILIDAGSGTNRSHENLLVGLQKERAYVFI